jgi:hypothetical protein
LAIETDASAIRGADRVLSRAPPSLRVREFTDEGTQMAAVETTSSAQAARKLRIEFLFLDLTTCTRCLGADQSLASAVEVVREVLEATGVEVALEKILVESEKQARALGFVSSPTIRVDGRDVALELRESSCGSEACTDGCGDQIACRVWFYRGREYTEPPVAMIVEAILERVYGATPLPDASEPARYELPENLARFFAGRTAAAESACCAPTDQESCCDVEAKDDCCGTATEQECACR